MNKALKEFDICGSRVTVAAAAPCCCASYANTSRPSDDVEKLRKTTNEGLRGGKVREIVMVTKALRGGEGGGRTRSAKQIVRGRSQCVGLPSQGCLRLWLEDFSKPPGPRRITIHLIRSHDENILKGVRATA